MREGGWRVRALEVWVGNKFGLYGMKAMRME